MYDYYVLRGTRGEEPVELDGEVNATRFPGIELDDGPTIISTLVQLLQNEGITALWDECELTNTFFDREDNYIYFDDRWMRRSNAPWRKDRIN